MSEKLQKLKRSLSDRMFIKLFILQGTIWIVAVAFNK